MAVIGEISLAHVRATAAELQARQTAGQAAKKNMPAFVSTKGGDLDLGEVTEPVVQQEDNKEVGEVKPNKGKKAT